MYALRIFHFINFVPLFAARVDNDDDKESGISVPVSNDDSSNDDRDDYDNSDDQNDRNGQDDDGNDGQDDGDDDHDEDD